MSPPTAANTLHEENTRVFTLLHTNDFHNRLTEAKAERLRSLRTSLGESGLLLDAGDAVSAGNMTFRPGGEPILEMMTAAGYDAMTIGNREFHFSQAGFRITLSRAAFPALCANIRPARSSPSSLAIEDEPSLPTQPYIVFPHRAGWKILVFGLTVPMITERMLSRKVSAYVFDNPVQKAAELVPALREKYAPDLVIALTHIGLKQDRVLAQTVPGIDLIIGGHSHDALPEGERVGETLIVQTGCYAHHAGRVEARREGNSPLQFTARLEAL